MRKINIKCDQIVNRTSGHFKNITVKLAPVENNGKSKNGNNNEASQRNVIKLVEPKYLFIPTSQKSANITYQQYQLSQKEFY